VEVPSVILSGYAQPLFFWIDGGTGTGLAPILTSRMKKNSTIPQARQNKKAPINLSSRTNKFDKHEWCHKEKPYFLSDRRS